MRRLYSLPRNNGVSLEVKKLMVGRKQEREEESALLWGERAKSLSCQPWGKKGGGKVSKRYGRKIWQTSFAVSAA